MATRVDADVSPSAGAGGSHDGGGLHRRGLPAVPRRSDGVSRRRPGLMFRDLHAYVAELERLGQLRRITAEVDPRLEVSAIVQRVVREEGPALLFERVRGAAFPLVMNLFGSRRR